MKYCFLVVLFCLFSFLSFCQPCNDSTGAALQSRMGWFNTYPESLIREKQSAIIFCQLFFKPEGGIDTFYLHNTESEELQKLFTDFISSIDFKAIYKGTISVIVPYIFKDENQLNIDFKITGKIFTDMFRIRRNSDAVCFVKPVYIIYYYPKPPKKMHK